MWKYYLKTRNRRAFTLVESLFALMINSLVILLVGMIFQTILKTESFMVNQKQNIEWHIFLNQIENDVVDKKITKVLSYEVALEEDLTKDKITYTLSAAKIRWLRNGTGYVPMLNKVMDVKFTEIENGLSIKSHFKNGQILRGSIAVEKKKD